MSGNDERIRDFPVCGCEEFEFWNGISKYNVYHACFNSDDYLGSSSHDKVFITYSAIESREERLETVVRIECEICKREASDEEFRRIMFLGKKYLNKKGALK